MYQELELRPRRGQGAALELIGSDDLPSFLTLVDTAIGTERAVHEIREGDRIRLEKRHLPASADILTLIFSRGNINVSDPQFQNIDTNKVWSAKKTERDAAIRSCHLFIRVEKINSRQHPTYKALLEEVPGLGRTYIQSLLNSITAAYEYDYDPGHGDPKQTATQTQLLAVKNKSVGDGKDGATIDTIELVREPETDGLDPTLIEAKPEVLPLRVKAGASPKKVMEAVRNYIKVTPVSDYGCRTHVRSLFGSSGRQKPPTCCMQRRKGFLRQGLCLPTAAT